MTKYRNVDLNRRLPLTESEFIDKWVTNDPENTGSYTRDDVTTFYENYLYDFYFDDDSYFVRRVTA